jgi:hypothetical protein
MSETWWGRPHKVASRAWDLWLDCFSKREIGRLSEL